MLGDLDADGDLDMILASTMGSSNFFSTHGNVWEWVADAYLSYSSENPLFHLMPEQRTPALGDLVGTVLGQ